MVHIFEIFFIISGILFWVCVGGLLIVNICRKCEENKVNEYESYCSLCDKDTTHEIIGYGFNESLICKICNNEK